MEWNEGYVVEAVEGLATARSTATEPCPLCGGAGRRSFEVEGVVRTGRCRCQRVPDRVKVYNAAGIPAKHAAATMESFRAELARPTWAAVRGFIDSYRPGADVQGLVIFGPPGRGKTHLLCAVLRELVFRHGVAARFVEFTHLLASIREGFDQKVSEARLVEPLVRVPILAIDEIGKGRGTDWEQSILDLLVSRRYNAHSGPILATTNFPPRAPRARRDHDSLATGAVTTLPEVLGDRVWSRIAENVKFVEAGGDDFRVSRGR